MGPRLVEMGVLSPIDRAAFLEFCDAVGRLEHWTRELAEHGSVQVTESGYEAQRPAVAFRTRAAADMKTYLALCGLSPAARSKVSADGPPAVDETARFFDRPRLTP